MATGEPSRGPVRVLRGRPGARGLCESVPPTAALQFQRTSQRTSPTRPVTRPRETGRDGPTSGHRGNPTTHHQGRRRGRRGGFGVRRFFRPGHDSLGSRGVDDASSDAVAGDPCFSRRPLGATASPGRGSPCTCVLGVTPDPPRYAPTVASGSTDTARTRLSPTYTARSRRDRRHDPAVRAGSDAPRETCSRKHFCHALQERRPLGGRRPVRALDGPRSPETGPTSRSGTGRAPVTQRARPTRWRSRLRSNCSGPPPL